MSSSAAPLRRIRTRKGKAGQVVNQAATEIKALDDRLEELNDLKDEINEFKGM